MPRDVVAYHEAGHAVAACLLKCRFGRISILPEAGSHRRVSLAQARARVLTEGYSAALDGLRGRALIEHQAMFALAGAVATAIREERPVDWGESEEDSRTARGWIEELTDDEDEVDAYLKWLSARTRVLLGRPRSWAAVTALAQTLLERGQLGGVGCTGRYPAGYRRLICRDDRHPRPSDLAAQLAAGPVDRPRDPGVSAQRYHGQAGRAAR